jgi:hypothetical protein
MLRLIGVPNRNVVLDPVKANVTSIIIRRL